MRNPGACPLLLQPLPALPAEHRPRERPVPVHWLRGWLLSWCASVLLLVASPASGAALGSNASTLSVEAADEAPAAAVPTGTGSAGTGPAKTTIVPRGIGRVVIASGATMADNAAGVARALTKGDWIYEGDALQTDPAARMQITFNDGGRLALRPATKLHVEAYHAADSSRPDQIAFRLERGGFRTSTGRIGRSNRTAYRFATPQAVIGIRGTDWGAVLVDDGDDSDDADGDEQLTIGVIDGGITVTNAGGSVELGDGAAFSYAVVESFDSPPMPQAEPPAGLGATLATPLVESTGADEAGATDDSAEAGEPPTEDDAAADEGATDAEATADAEPTDNTDADAAPDTTAAAGASGETADDTVPLLELGGPDAGDTDVVFEYSNRCF